MQQCAVFANGGVAGCSLPGRHSNDPQGPAAASRRNRPQADLTGRHTRPSKLMRALPSADPARQAPKLFSSRRRDAVALAPTTSKQAQSTPWRLASSGSCRILSRRPRSDQWRGNCWRPALNLYCPVERLLAMVGAGERVGTAADPGRRENKQLREESAARNSAREAAGAQSAGLTAEFGLRTAPPAKRPWMRLKRSSRRSPTSNDQSTIAGTNGSHTPLECNGIRPPGDRKVKRPIRSPATTPLGFGLQPGEHGISSTPQKAQGRAILVVDDGSRACLRLLDHPAAGRELRKSRPSRGARRGSRRLARRFRPDLVITDLRMDQMDGHRVAEGNSRAGGPGLRVIILTRARHDSGWPFHADAKRSVRASLTKPVDKQDLLDHVQKP